MPAPRVLHSTSLKLALAALLIATTIALLPAGAGEFVTWDDPHNLVDNPAMNGPTFAGIAWHWKHPYKDLYIPVTYTLWGLVAAVARTRMPNGEPALNSYVFHAINLALHLGSAVIVFAILRRLVTSTWAAWCGAMVFALHPLQVEAVAWISGMKDVLAGLLGLAAVLLYLEHAISARNGRGGRAVWLWAAGGALLVLAMLSKPSAVSIPLMAAAIDLLLLRRSSRAVIPPVLGWLILCAPIIYITRHIQPATVVAFVPPVWARPIIAADALAFYTRQLIWPISLGIDYGRSPQWLWSSRQFYFTWLVPLAMGIAAIAWRRRAPHLAAGATVFALSLVPVLGFLPFDYQSYSTITDHYVYAGMLGAGIAVAGILAGRKPAAFAVGFAAIALLAIRSGIQTTTWSDSETLFKHAIEVNPDSLAGNANLGAFYADQAQSLWRAGRPEAARLPAERSIELTRRALRVAPHDPPSHYNLGQMYSVEGRAVEAEAEYRESLRFGAANPDAHTALGAALANQRRFDEAIEEFQQALQLDPRNELAQWSLKKAMALRSTTQPGQPRP